MTTTTTTTPSEAQHVPNATMANRDRMLAVSPALSFDLEIRSSSKDQWTTKAAEFATADDAWDFADALSTRDRYAHALWQVVEVRRTVVDRSREATR